MPFILLFLLLAAGTAAFMYFNKNSAQYTHKEDKPSDSSDVIYLPHTDTSNENSDNDDL